MFLKNSSLLGGVLWRVLPASIAVLVTIWMVVIEVSEQSLEKETVNRIEERTEGLAQATDARLSNLLFAVRNLAATSLVVNGLIHQDSSGDAGGEQSYLNAFFRSLKIAGLKEVSLKVLDYRGRLLVGAELEDYQEASWVDSVMSGGEPLFIDPQRRLFKFATPIEYQGAPEGILLLEVERKVLLEYLGEQLPMGAILLRSSDNAVLYSALWGVDDELGFVDEGDDPGMIESEQELGLFPAITLRYGEKREQALASLDKLHSTLLVVLLLDLIALVVGIVVAGRSVVRPITEMTDQLKAQERSPELSRELKMEGVAEVDRLATTYNQLQQVTQVLNQQIREQYETMNRVFSSMADGLIVLDEEMKIVEVNPAAERLLGSDSTALLRQEVSRFIESREQQPEVTIHPADGEDIPALCSESRADDARYTIWVLHDLRERLKAEQQEQYGAFQAGIAEMGASVLHNIGNAITGMVGNVSNVDKQIKVVKRVARLLQDQGGRSAGEGAPDPQRMGEVLTQSGALLQKISGDEGVGGYLAKLNTAISHVGEVISIQQSAARPVVHATQFRLSSLLQDTLGLIQDGLDKRKITFVSRLDEQLPVVTLPRNPMIQLLLNLIKNSMEAIMEQMQVEPELSGEIVLSARLITSHTFEILIRDNGSGLAQEMLEEVFQPRVSTKKRGSGYGLHSAANFISSLGGEIVLESEGKGFGAQMRIELPLQVKKKS